MTSIGLHGLVARCGMHLIVDGLRWKNPTTGRQGKSAASGRARMVGWAEFNGPFSNRAGWRFNSKPERFQRSDRHRCPAEPALAP
jgi:hypothetical protein